MTNNNINPKGFILIEVLVAIAIFVLFSSAMVSMVLGSLTVVEKSSDYSYALNLSQENIEAVKIIQKKAWNDLSYTKSSVEFDGEWVLNGENTESLTGKFKRYVIFEPVYRDENGFLLNEETANSFRDVNTLKIISKVIWSNNNKELSVSNNTYISNWESAIWSQNDWSGGSGQEYYIEEDRFFSSESIRIGETLSLEEVATGTLATSGYLESSAFGPVNTGVFSVISWEDEIGGECLECYVKIQIKTAPDLNGSPGNWDTNWLGPNNTGESEDFFINKEGELINKINNGNKWILYRITLLGDGLNSPEFKGIKIYYK